MKYQIKAKKERRKNEPQFWNVFEAIPRGMLMYHLEPDGRLVLICANPAANTILGVDLSLLYGKTIEEAFPPLRHTEAPERFREVASKGVQWSTEQIAYEDNKIKGSYEVNAFQTSPQRMIASFTDITESKKKQEEWAKLFHAIEQSPVLVLITDARGSIEYVNPKFLQSTGYSLSEIIGKNPRILKSGKQSPQFYKHLWKTISQGNVWRGEFSNKKKNGSL